MTTTTIIEENKQKIMTPSESLLRFMQDVDHGLSQNEKQLSSKYFYDDCGSDLFNQITQHPDYYLTLCELEILQKYKQALALHFKHEPFNLIELGPGEGIKTRVLLHYFLSKSLTFRYVPIDISSQYLDLLTKKIHQDMKSLSISAIKADFLEGLTWQCDHSHRRNVVMFLGSSIGNFNPSVTQQFLHNLRSAMHDGDYALLGFDLIKDENILLNAYDDDYGLTADFNLNLLGRINRELGGQFDLQTFSHHAFYNRDISAMESFLISKTTQEVAIDSLKKSFHFGINEPIHMEFSYKYSLERITELAKKAGFNIVEHYTDRKNYFVDSLWQAK